ncbi:MAG: Crp/Fnr family transcriptional regulator [Bacteroidota bacterium]
MIRINRELLNYLVTLKNSGSHNSIVERTAGVGEKILYQQTYVRSLYVMKDGLAKCFLTLDNGNDFIQEFFGAGEVFGEIELITGHISFCTIEALIPTTYYQIPEAVFHQLLADDSTFNNLVLGLLATNIRYSALRHSYNQTHSLEESLRRLTQEFPELLQKISKKDIANYLGTTVRSLNRVLKEVSN